MVVGFVRCAGCDREMPRADVILHRTATGSRFFCATCMKVVREAEARDAAAPGEVATDRADVDLEKKLAVWERFYNYDRPHGAHRGKTPYEALREKLS